MTYREMIKETKKNETENQSGKWNVFGEVVLRNLSYPMTFVLGRTSITPNQVTFISLICTFIGFFMMIIPSKTMINELIGLLFFVLWGILDCVDGNIARIKKQFSKVGDLWDAAAGYSALCLMLFSMGICSYSAEFDYSWIFIVLGGASGILTLYPRLLMHFKYHGETNEVNNINQYGFLKKIMFMIISPDALIIPFMFLAIVFSIEQYFTIAYFIIEVVVTVYTCVKLLRE